MNNSKTLFGAVFILLALMSFGIVACQREDVFSSNATNLPQRSQTSFTEINETGNTASAHIAASEKLELPAIIEVPQNLPVGNTRVATFYAVGVQKYKARVKAGTDPVVYEWVLVAPQANLYDASNANVGTHSAGPNWELSPADSIFGQHFSPARTAPSPDAESIDWLLLKPKIGTIPTGIFADVDYIQRIATKGGKAPLTAPTNIDETVEVKYKAVYRFTKMN